jgi:hypothetical protein
MGHMGISAAHGPAEIDLALERMDSALASIT